MPRVQQGKSNTRRFAEVIREKKPSVEESGASPELILPISSLLTSLSKNAKSFPKVTFCGVNRWKAGVRDGEIQCRSQLMRATNVELFAPVSVLIHLIFMDVSRG